MNSKIVRDNEIISSDMDEDTVMMSIESGKYYGINPVGSRIWKLLEQPCTAFEICDTLCKEYDVKPAECRQDVLKFVNNLLEKKLVKKCDLCG